MKQTATEYLFEKLWATPKDKFTWQMILREAKNKERRQIEEAFIVCNCAKSSRFDAKKYYQQTYENESNT